MTTSGKSAPKERWPISSERTLKARPRSAARSKAAIAVSSARRSISTVRSPPAPVEISRRPPSVPMTGETTARTSSAIPAKRPSQSRSVSGSAARGARRRSAIITAGPAIRSSTRWLVKTSSSRPTPTTARLKRRRVRSAVPGDARDQGVELGDEAGPAEKAEQSDRHDQQRPEAGHPAGQEGVGDQEPDQAEDDQDQAEGAHAPPARSDPASGERAKLSHLFRFLLSSDVFDDRP